MAEIRFLFTGAQVAAFRRGGQAGSGAGAAMTPVRWRLLGRNNRELGRSVHVFLDQAMCRDAVYLLQRQLAEARPVVVGDPAGTGRWVWRLYLSRVPVATVGRSYARHRECLFNLRQFLAAVPLAAPVGGGVADLVEHAGESG